jgi:hypothetical protein
MRNSIDGSIPQRKIIWGAIAAFLLSLVWPVTTNMVEELDAGEVMVIQSFWSGDLTWHTTPGPKLQAFGKVTKYHLRDQLWFIDPKTGENIPKDAQGQLAIDIRFNDGGHARINGSMAYEIPADIPKLTEMHRRYNNQDNLESQVVRAIVEKAIYMTGPMMSSTESYASRRNELISDIEDQVQRGVFKTETVKQVHVVKDKDGKPLREQASLLETLGMKAYNLSIKRVEYDSVVEKQIQGQQQSVAEAQMALITSRTAEQRKLTEKATAAAEEAKLVGAATAKKAEEVTKAQMGVDVAALTALKAKTNAVIEAQQKLEVADLAVKEAEAFKKSEVLKGEGEAGRRKAVLEADGALEKKLEAYVKVNELYAAALSKYTGNLVPGIVMGGASGSNGAAMGADAFQQMMLVLSARAARELELDLRMGSKTK